jgi:hypothetical protein
LSGASQSLAHDMYDSTLACAGSTLVTCEYEATPHDTHVLAQRSIDNPNLRRNRLLRAQQALLS